MNDRNDRFSPILPSCFLQKKLEQKWQLRRLAKLEKNPPPPPTEHETNHRKPVGV